MNVFLTLVLLVLSVLNIWVLLRTKKLWRHITAHDQAISTHLELSDSALKAVHDLEKHVLAGLSHWQRKSNSTSVDINLTEPNEPTVDETDPR